MDDIKRFFILGNPRSGTSLFRLMLNAHPEIICPPESGFMHWWWGKYKNWNQSNNNEKDIQAYINDILKSKKIETWNFDRDVLHDLIIESQPVNYRELTTLVYLNYQQNDVTEIKYIGDKNNYYINYINDLIEIWPDAYFIHLVRDVRDVYCSYLEVNNLVTDSPYKPTLSSNPSEVANDWLINNVEIEKVKKIKPDRYYFLRYEDLILDTKNTLKKLCDFLNIEFSKKLLNYYINGSKTNLEPKETLDWKTKTKEKPDTSKVNRFKSELSIAILNEINKSVGSKLNEYGYK